MDERDWAALSSTWRSSGLPEPDAERLGSLIRAKRQRLGWAHGFDCAAAAALLAYAFWLGAGLGAALAGLTVGVWALVTWNRRDLWQPPTASVREQLRWYRRRCRRQRRTIVIAWAVFAATSALVWTSAAFASAFLGAFAVALGAWSAWYGRALRTELARIAALEQEFSTHL